MVLLSNKRLTMKKFLFVAAVAALSAGSAAASTIKAQFWNADRSFSTVDQAIAYADANAVTATFESTVLNYPNQGNNVSSRNTTLADFLGPDAASLSGAGNTNLTTSVFRFEATLDLAPGAYKITVGSDDGYRLFFDGALVSERVRPRGFRDTVRLDVNVDGPTEFELYYYENFGRTGVTFSINDVVVDSNIIAPIPIPASLPLLLAGIGAFGIARRRAKA